jgi:hypothetical protein
MFFEVMKTFVPLRRWSKIRQSGFGTNPDGYHADNSMEDCGKWKAEAEKL